MSEVLLVSSDSGQIFHEATGSGGTHSTEPALPPSLVDSIVPSQKRERQTGSCGNSSQDRIQFLLIASEICRDAKRFETKYIEKARITVLVDNMV